MAIRWSKLAAADLERTLKHIQKSNPKAARQVATALYDACSSLEMFPNRGRPGRRKGWRELIVQSLPYIIVYRINEDVVEILRIYHTARERPEN